MTHNQHPIGTGFTAASTVDDVLAGIDLTGKTSSSPEATPGSAWWPPGQ